MYAETQIYTKQKEVNYPTSEDIKVREKKIDYVPPAWQIDYNNYGGIQGYQKTVKKFWREANRFLHSNESSIIVTFPNNAEDRDLFNQFRKDIYQKIELPAKYDIYKNY